MRKIFLVSLLACAAAVSYADESNVPLRGPTLELQLLNEPLSVGHQADVRLRLLRRLDGLLVSDQQLKTVHTKKIHLLIIDPTLTDYQHIHPDPSATPGNYEFIFTPKLPGGYRVWADVTPIATGKQEFPSTDLGVPAKPHIDKTPSYSSTVKGYHFTLTFDEPPTVGKASTGTIHITDGEDNPVTTLEPVMGAFAHIVGFYDDFQTIVHVHPMGEEPKNDNARAGPDLTFHFQPDKARFIKLFAQVKINGQDIYAPFGVDVAK